MNKRLSGISRGSPAWGRHASTPSAMSVRVKGLTLDHDAPPTHSVPLRNLHQETEAEFTQEGGTGREEEEALVGTVLFRPPGLLISRDLEGIRSLPIVHSFNEYLLSV